MPKDRLHKVSCSNYRCEIEVTLEILCGKWKALLIWNLSRNNVIRFNEFKRLIPDITQKMLSQQLRDLEQNGLVQKTIYPQVPPAVEYSLTELGKELVPILEAMDKWGKNFVDNYKHSENSNED
ncbi:MAG: HxlR family transcriptional regulator [Peptoclostridium sp.]|uniref:winged helix-turn-helix transcriptional regulator n=1 Tax=Peptoclostridium sp. TaxID=1904860 RepID=UPI00139D080F|nr:helix-turn-helix domain-containing protein [Peptoclostridium sp.]MZQ74721.1 HxlR family transcriptional regulator [Peptoclostridium sp.]